MKYVTLFGRRSTPQLLGAATTSLALLAAVGVVQLASEGSAQAQELRFHDTKPGNVVATGNTLGLSKQASLNGPGTSDAIGTFIAADPTSIDNIPPNPGNEWFMGTTNDWHDNQSSGVLTLPSAESDVLYAELVWGGSSIYGLENVSADLDTPVTLTFGGGAPLTVDPDPNTAVSISKSGTFAINYYMRSADVTDYVKQHGAGTYATAGVPATQDSTVNTTNAAGWTLIVAYRYDGEPIRDLSVFVGGTGVDFVDENTTVDYTIDGFCAPPAGEIKGTIAISTMEGDANRVGDQLAIAPTAANPNAFVPLSGPNNPVNNFFCSQINGPNGTLDTSGTFGTKNHGICTAATDCTGAATTNVSGGRQGWDIANVELSSMDGQLSANQTSAVLRTQTESDSYMPTSAGLAIDVNAPKFLYDQSTTTVDKDDVTLGDTFELTVKIVNQGAAPANNVLFTLPVASGITLQSFTTNGAAGDINGAAVQQSQLATGVAMGSIAANESRIVVLDFQVTAAQSSDIVLKPVWKYGYNLCINGTPIDEVFNAKAVGLTYDGGTGTGGAGQGGAGGGAGTSSGGSSGEGGAGGGAEAFTATPQGGGLFDCSASAVGERGSSGGLAAFAGLALAGVVIARRKKRG
ncbi:MAG TPA: hypothetical protein VL400_25615 [Polyangiaceae bacterium]|jgi:uncharacterized repeat protein (TIGR01451 family)|nr:hypothetical protein [Polyangiaceae bacterium]